MRCQLGLPRRSDGTNCRAPSRLYRVTLTMCTVTGIGEATNRALFAVISGPPISSVRRTAPARTGMRLSTISPTGAATPGCGIRLGRPGRLVPGTRMLAATSVMAESPTMATAAGHRADGRTRGRYAVARLSLAVRTRAHSPARPELTPPAPPLAARTRCGSSANAGGDTAPTASRPPAQRGRIAGAERRDAKQQAAEHIQHRCSDHSVGRAPRLASLADPVKIPRKPSANFGASVANSGKIKASKKVKPA